MAEKIIVSTSGQPTPSWRVMEGGDPVVIPTRKAAARRPSVVAFTKDGERLVGQVAKRQAVTNPQNTIFSIKRFMDGASRKSAKRPGASHTRLSAGRTAWRRSRSAASSTHRRRSRR